jgi:large subunit ribosomal protein L4
MYDAVKSVHSYTIPKKKKTKAIAMILTKKLMEGTFYVMKEMAMNEIKTKSFTNNCFLKEALFIDTEFNNNFLLSMRNLYKYKALNLNGLNSLYLLKSKAVVFSESALRKLEERYEK